MSSTAIAPKQKVSAFPLIAWAPGYESALPVLKHLSIPARFLAFASRPWADKSIAVAVSVPAFWVAYDCYQAGLMDLPRALFFTQAALFVVTMLMRRNPVRISANPWFWLVASINTYYNLLTAGWLRGGVRLAPAPLINSLAILGIWVAIFARLSLGRNIGLVPAQRQIVTSGMYRYVRHPIYSAYFLCAISWGLSSCSLINALVIALGCLMYVIKTLMEESFLSEDPEYAAYMKRVRWRWFPGLA
jgi:protein-S-isoprenylcysteine O-methyltransferase Ste14